MLTKMLMVMVVMWVWMAGAARGNKREQQCKLDNIQTMQDFTWTEMAGIWHVAYLGHTPGYLQNAADITYHAEPFGPDSARVTATRIEFNGTCSVFIRLTYLDPKARGVFRANVAEGVQRVDYVLATDYVSTIALFDEILVDGVRDEELSTLTLSVRDPTQEPNMQVVGPALKKLCGKAAMSLDFYDKLTPDPSAQCVQE